MKKLIITFLFLILPSIINAQSISTTTCPGAGCQYFNTAGQGSFGIQITGTWVGTITFQSSLGTTTNATFTSLLVTPSNSTTAVSTTTANGVWTTPIAGINQVRVVFTAYTSGTANILVRTTSQARANGGGGGGGGGSGTVTQIDTNSPLTGGPITTTGTIDCTTCGVTGSPLSQFASTTSAQLAGVISNETGTGSLVFGTGPTITLANGTGLPVSTGISGLGTGVATALAVNTGSAGAFVLFNGALGTPSSGTLTSATGLPVSTGISGLGTNVATALAVNVGSAGAFVTFNGALGTPSSGTLSNATGLPISTGVSGLGSNVATFLATPSSANLASALTDETGTGLSVFSTSPTLTTPAITTSSTLSNNGIGAVSTDGFVLQNTTAAAVGAQQWSPRVHLIGQGWKTTATAASQTTDWIIENQPVQGTTNPTTNLVFSSQVNAGGYGNAIAFNSSGQIVPTNGSSGVPAIGWNIGSNNIGFYRDSNSTLIFTYNGSDALGLKASSLTLGPSTSLAWGASAISNPDLFLFRDAAATLAQRNSTNAQAFRIYETFTDASNYERYNFTSGSDVLAVTATSAGTGSANLGISFAPKGSGFVTTTSIATAGSGMTVANVGANSCGTTAATIAGNDNNGEITVGATAGTQCRIAFTKAAPNRWDCTANNETTANLLRATYVDTTHVDVLGTMVAGDTLGYHCIAR